MLQILTAKTMESNVTNVWCEMKDNGKVFHLLHRRYIGPNNYARQLIREVTLCYVTEMMATIFITYKTLCMFLY